MPAEAVAWPTKNTTRTTKRGAAMPARRLLIARPERFWSLWCDLQWNRYALGIATTPDRHQSPRWLTFRVQADGDRQSLRRPLVTQATEIDGVDTLESALLLQEVGRCPPSGRPTGRWEFSLPSSSFCMRCPPRGFHRAAPSSALAQARVISRMPACRCETGVAGQSSDTHLPIRRYQSKESQ